MLVIITIHKGASQDLLATYYSVLPLLSHNFINGYLIYDSSDFPTDLPPVIDTGKIVYLPSMPTEGISTALNKSQQLAVDMFPCSTHHTFFHSADKCIASAEVINDIAAVISKAHYYDLAFFAGVNRFHDRDEILKPRCDRLLSGMSVTHIGTIISHKLHSSLGGYSCKYRYAMDYDFFLRAFIRRRSVYTTEHPIAVISMTGVSTLHPYRALKDCLLSRMNIAVQLPHITPLLIYYSIVSFAKRFTFDVLLLITPRLLLKFRIISSRGRLDLYNERKLR